MNNAIIPSQAAPFVGADAALRFHRNQFSMREHPDGELLRPGDYFLILPMEKTIREGKYLDSDGAVWRVTAVSKDRLLCKEICSDRADYWPRAEFEEKVVGLVVGIMKIENSDLIRDATGTFV